MTNTIDFTEIQDRLDDLTLYLGERLQAQIAAGTVTGSLTIESNGCSINVDLNKFLTTNKPENGINRNSKKKETVN